MRFITLEPEEFAKFANKSPYKTFTQTPEIAKLREQNGWTAYYFGVTEADKIIAAAMLVAKPTFLGKSIYICPGGPLMDYENKELVQFFFKRLKSFIKSHNGYTLHISPNYELIERDRDGNPVPNGFNHQSAVTTLTSLGFREIPSSNPKYLFTLDLKGKTPEGLFKTFKQNHRNLINRTKRAGITVRELKREELGIFKQITESTSERRHFEDRPLSYYQQMYDLFAKKGQVKFLIAEIDIRKKESENIHSRPLSDDGSEWSERVENELFLTPLSVAMFILYGDEVTYLYSGSDERYMKEYNAQYAIQWYMIEYAIKHKFKTYNFYGIQGLPDPTKSGYGIYKFKKGFTTPENGKVIELLGTYELAINQPFYHLHHLLSGLKHR